MSKSRRSLRAGLALAVSMSGLPAAAWATDVSNYTFNPYAHRTIVPTAPTAAPPPARHVAPLPSPTRPNTAALPLPDNGACVGLCRLLELMWRLERPGQIAPVPTS